MACHGHDEIVLTGGRLLACIADIIAIPGEDRCCFRSTKVPPAAALSTARDLLLVHSQKLRAFSRRSAGLPELAVGPQELLPRKCKSLPSARRGGLGDVALKVNRCVRL